MNDGQLPAHIEVSARLSAKNLLGSGYVDSYYDGAASEFTWLYVAGFRAGKEAERARAQKARRKKAKLKS